MLWVWRWANLHKAAANPLEKQVWSSEAVRVMCSRLINSCLHSDNPWLKIRGTLLNLLQYICLAFRKLSSTVTDQWQMESFSVKFFHFDKTIQLWVIKWQDILKNKKYVMIWYRSSFFPLESIMRFSTFSRFQWC